MSEGPRISKQFAWNLAQRMLDLLAPYCERIEIAGSLRRGKETIGDIEMVAIPKVEKDLLGEPVYQGGMIEEVLRAEGYTFSKNGPLMKQFYLPPVASSEPLKWELYLTTPEKWGVIYLIRTGSEDFAHRMVTSRQQGGLMPSNLQVKDGRVWLHGEALETPEEADVFRLWGMPCIPPFTRE